MPAKPGKDFVSHSLIKVMTALSQTLGSTLVEPSNPKRQKLSEQSDAKLLNGKALVRDL